jgi:glycosyltransferase involved in cell wall biosynthesis
MLANVVMIGSAPGTRGGVASLVELYASQGLFQRWGVSYVPTHRDGSKLRKLGVAIGAWIDVMWRLALGHVSLLHVHIASDASFWRKAMFIVPARVLGVPYILHMHGGDFIGFCNRARLPGLRSFIRWVYRGAARVIALSEEWRGILASEVPGSRTVVIPNPVDIPAWSASLAALPPQVLYLGVLVERKGVLDLVHAWARVVARHPEARLVLAGSGMETPVKELARSLGVEGSIEMPGWIGPDERARLLRTSWVFTLPSHLEAMPMAVLEAMAAGLPVVATRVGGIPTAVTHGTNGFLVDPRDPVGLAQALDTLLSDASLRRAMGRASRARAHEHFSPERIVPRIEALWLESRAGTPARTEPRA